MTDITSSTTLKAQYHLSGVNVAILNAASGSAGDTIELDTLLESEGLGKRVKVVRYASCTEDFDGTPVVIPMKWNETNDTLTVGTGPSSAEITIRVEYE